jgi:hypothetical protein
LVLVRLLEVYQRLLVVVVVAAAFVVWLQVASKNYYDWSLVTQMHTCVNTFV